MAPNLGISKRNFSAVFIMLLVDTRVNKNLMIPALSVFLIKGLIALVMHCIIDGSEQQGVSVRSKSSSYVLIVFRKFYTTDLVMCELNEAALFKPLGICNLLLDIRSVSPSELYAGMKLDFLPRPRLCRLKMLVEVYSICFLQSLKF